LQWERGHIAAIVAYLPAAILGGMADDSPPSGADKFTVRFPAGMRERIRAAAAASGRSMNGEIIASISAGLDGGGKVDVGELAERIVDALVDRLAGRPADGRPKEPSRRRGK
jgi:Arc-like DNA binding domain